MAGACLNPCPENPAPTTTGPWRSNTNSASGVEVHVLLSGVGRVASSPGSQVTT